MRVNTEDMKDSIYGRIEELIEEEKKREER